MATAVTTSSQPRTPTRPAGLALASLTGAVYVLAALAVVFYAVPELWALNVAPHVPAGYGWVGDGLRLAVQAAAAVALVWFGQTLAGANPPRGLRGGIFLTISAACAVFFTTRAVGLWTDGTRFEGGTGQVVTAVVGLVLVFLAARLLTSPRGGRWMTGLEEQGWLNTNSYKKALGQRVRRLTILGVLLVGGSGAWVLYNHGTLPDAWTISLPFTQQDGAPEGVHKTFTLVTHAKVLIPFLLACLTLWVGFRAVNLPAFAEFLIATEAEMNKVSWTSRRRLFQDTVVVLVTTIFMALFLLAVDLFWGWLLSQSFVGVLPSKAEKEQREKATQRQDEAVKW